MQVSIAAIISLIAVRDDALTRAVHAAIGDNMQDTAYVLTQGDADSIAAHIGRMQDANTLASHNESARLFGSTPSEDQWQMSVRLNAAAQNAIKLFGLCGLRTPSVWLD